MSNINVDASSVMLMAKAETRAVEVRKKMAGSSTTDSKEQSELTVISDISNDASVEAADTQGEGTDVMAEDAVEAAGDIVVDEAALKDMEAAAAGDVWIEEPMPIEGGYKDEGMYFDPTMGTGVTEVKDPLLSSWPFVIGLSAGILLVSIVLGALLARRKIKKGIEIYED